jgi:hypothetical protein
MLQFNFEEMPKLIYPKLDETTISLIDITLLTNKPVLINIDDSTIVVNIYNNALLFKNINGEIISTISAVNNDFSTKYHEILHDIFIFCDAYKDGYLFRHYAFGDIHAFGYVVPPRQSLTHVINMIFDVECEKEKIFKNVINACDDDHPTNFIEYLLDEMIERNDFEMLQYMTHETKNILIETFTTYADCYKYLPYLIKYGPHTGPDLELL